LEKSALRDLISLGFEAQKEDVSSKVLLERIKALANRFDLPGEGYDLSQWDLSRFSGELEPEQFLVHNFIPSGIAGTLYGAGGTGKSTLGLDLSVRVSVAGVYPTKWLDKFQVEEGRRVLYISAEEPEKILQRRLKGLNEAIADELGVEADTLWKTALPNFFIVNLWGKPVQLFDIKGASISPTNEYARILATLIKENIGLLVIDTRSRVSPAEGAGNAIVAREVSFYEQWAALSGASVLILHHSNKASYNGAVHAQAAQRGESSFTDCLRFGIYLQAMSEETAASNGIREEERKNYLSVTHAKSNYTRIQDPIVLHRNGWSFELTDFKAKPIREEMKARQAEEDLALMLQAIRENPGINQREAMKHFKGRLSPFRVREALKNAATGNLITTTSGERGALHYFVNELSASP
jgi:RecA-family ATPase